jgi:RNA polymerase sigma-70 factor (ECF subfamily)
VKIHKRLNSTSPELDDFDPLHRESRGELEAFASLYDRYAGVLHSLALRILNNAQEAESVLREVFLHHWEKREKRNPSAGGTPAALISQVRNRCIDQLRARKRYRELVRESAEASSPVTSETGDPDTSTFNQGRRALIRSSFQSLTNEQRDAIELAYFSGLTRTEIAGVLQASPDVIRSRIHEGMMKLREAIESEGRNTE